MATTYQEHTGNGSLTTFSYPFPVLKTEDIKVALDGVTQTTGYTATTSPAQVVFTTAPEDGVVVRVYRDTDVDSAKGVFAAGSSIRAADLNNNQDQVLYALQEEQNQKGIFESITLDDGGQIKLGNSDDFTLTWYSAGFADITAPIINIEGDVRFKPNVGIRFIIEDTEIRTLVDFKPWGSNIDLGKSDSQWKDLYVDGTGYIDTINADNITVSGNVDGRDISVDGTKLDTVETNAKDDQTAAEIKTLLQSDKLSISEINTTSLDSHTDGRYYTETEADARFYNLASEEEIQSGKTWVAADNKVATTAAIDARIVDLVDDVGGFVPIANETSFPNANPDINNGAGTLVSVPLANNVTSNGSGVITISNGTVGNSTVTINGAGDTKTYAQGFGIIVETTTTLNTYTFHRYVPKATEVTTVAGNITNINTVAGNNSNITTVAGISANVTTVAGISSDVTSVAGDATDIGTVAGAIGNVNNVGGNISNVNSVAGNATNINAAVSNASNINTCATNISSITDASTQATNAANSATAAASSATTATTQATTATTQATTATTQATTATTKATNAAASASNAATSETNAATSETNSATFKAVAEEYKNLAYDYKNAASGFFTQEVSSTYNLADNVASHTAWGDVTAETGFHNEHLGSDTALTMSTGSSTYDYGSIT